jgi:hypothetical protein
MWERGASEKEGRRGTIVGVALAVALALAVGS